MVKVIVRKKVGRVQGVERAVLKRVLYEGV